MGQPTDKHMADFHRILKGIIDLCAICANHASELSILEGIDCMFLRQLLATLSGIV